MTSSSEDPVRQVLSDAMAHLYSAALRAAVLLDVAEHLADGPRDAADLAGEIGAHGPSLHRLLRFLAGRGVFREDEDGRFHLTPAGDVLRADAPRTVRTAVLGMTSDLCLLPATGLAAALRDGGTAFEHRFGRPLFEYLAENPEAGDEFNQAMVDISTAEGDAILAVYDFPGSGVVVDVGGGHGALLLSVLRAHPGLRGVLLDQDAVVAGHLLGQLGGDDRWEVVAGDFFDSVPPGDLLVLKNVLHDWDDEQCARILGNCRRALRPGGRVLVVDAVIPPGNEPDFSKLLDMSMLTLLPGRERTEPQFRDLFDRAGLRLTRVVRTAGVFSLIEAVPG
ncbi:methyltransferase [Saccharothrix syringae]|uniref:SAM-dependent methyltransferase n=1 Tax=Saccharothrix syringae TaxID=103733 RepID=A0A5Q0H4F8_SACSY|nr:methyltransferase [Saccharothrix syringae]QFZ20804.1 SAM-dependent methyltransferase [Saccharothrix syringae]